MKYRKGIRVSDATEKELLRYQMEKIVKESETENLGEVSIALAELYQSLKNSHARAFLRILVSFYLIVHIIILIKEFFGRKV